jgi:transposase-like protein
MPRLRTVSVLRFTAKVNNLTDEHNYPNIRAVNSALADNENLSKHNKEILEEFFDEWRDRTNYCDGYASRFNSAAEYIDFKLEEATREDLKGIYKKVSRGEISKRNGEKFAPATQEKFHKAFGTFYRNFIGYPNEGYERREINGPSKVDGLKDILDNTVSRGVNIETKPSPSEVLEVAKTRDSLRDRCVIIIGWSLGARAGELFYTEKKPSPLKWKDVKFNDDDTMSVKLQINNKKERSNRRRVTVSVGKPLMEKLYEEKNPDREEPVFQKENPALFCPKCDSRVEKAAKNRDRQMTTSYNREYRCKDCSRVFKRPKLVARKQPLTREAANNIIKKAVKESEIRNLDNTSHKFFRKARALQKVAMNWNDGSINGFFGWEIGSSAKKRYMDALQVSQKKDLQEEHPELDINVEGRFHDNGLKPKKCSRCDTLNSRLWDFCRECGHECTYQGLLMKGEEDGSKKNDIKHEVKDWGMEYLMENPSVEDSDFKQKMTEVLDKKIEQEMGA